MDWQTVISTAVGTFVGVLAGWMITAYYARQGSRELRQEAEGLRQQSERSRRLTLMLIDILDAQGKIEVSKRNPETGEPSSYPVGTEAPILYDVEATPPLWQRMWRKVFGG